MKNDGGEEGKDRVGQSVQPIGTVRQNDPAQPVSDKRDGGGGNGAEKIRGGKSDEVSDRDLVLGRNVDVEHGIGDD